MTKRTNGWTVGAFIHDGFSWIAVAGSGRRMNEEDARQEYQYSESDAAVWGGVAELRKNGVLMAEYRSPAYRPGGRKYDCTL